jgi:choline-sulfatase
MTGKLCSNIAAWDNAAQLPSDIPTFAHYFRLLGYRTCLSGKMHFVGPDQLHGFEERLTTDICPSDFNWSADWDDPWRLKEWFHNMKNVRNAGIAERSLQQDYDEEVAYSAMRRIFDWAREADKRPFLLVSSFTHPHDPYVTPRRFYDLYRPDEIDMPRVPFIVPEKRDPHSRRLWEQYDRGEYRITDEHVRTARHSYYGSISYVDQQIGEVIAALKRTRLLDSTVLIFCADHGDMIGERGLWYKMSFYEWSSHVPLIMSGPGIPRGHRVRAICSLIDVLPTLIGIAHGSEWRDYPEPIDGKSLLPLFTTDEQDRIAVSELLSEGVAAPYVMVRKGRFKFTYVEHDPPQLFDMEADPDEINDLAQVPTWKALVDEFKAIVATRWDLQRLESEIVRSQRRRRLVYKALTTGKVTAWDYQPWQDASKLYYRGTKPYHEAEERDILAG